MTRVITAIYIPFGICLIGYFVYRLFQGHLEMHWLGIAILCNIILNKVFPVTASGLEEQAINQAKKIFRKPILANQYLIEKNITLHELEKEISLGNIQAYELDQVLIVENN